MHFPRAEEFFSPVLPKQDAGKFSVEMLTNPLGFHAAGSLVGRSGAPGSSQVLAQEHPMGSATKVFSKKTLCSDVHCCSGHSPTDGGQDELCPSSPWACLGRRRARRRVRGLLRIGAASLSACGLLGYGHGFRPPEVWSCGLAGIGLSLRRGPPTVWSGPAPAGVVLEGMVRDLS